MQALVSRCHRAASLVTYGKSSNGTPLYALEIYAGKASEVDRPSFKFTGSLHGDEPSGRQLLLSLAEHLCSALIAKSDPFIIDLLTRVSIVLIPAANPDGFAARKRANGQNKDLNRDFPDPMLNKGHDLKLPLTSSAPETQSMMALMQKRRFIGALDLHEGALVANYPLDGYPDGSENVKGQINPSQDDETFVSLAKLFSALHKTMADSKEFPYGITNGARWYPIYGGMQDWSYFTTGTFSIVLELSDNKWPDAKRLAQMWDECKDALVKYPSALVLGGLLGNITDSSTKAPISGAIVSVMRNSTGRLLGINVTSRGTLGDFYRPLAPGSYSVLVEAKGYESLRVDEVVVPPFLGEKQGAHLSIELKQRPGGSSQDPSKVVSSPFGLNATGNKKDGVFLVPPQSTVLEFVEEPKSSPNISVIGVGLYVLGIPLACGAAWIIWRRSYTPTA